MCVIRKTGWLVFWFSVALLFTGSILLTESPGQDGPPNGTFELRDPRVRGPEGVVFSPDSQWLVCQAQMGQGRQKDPKYAIATWDVNTRKLLHVLSLKGIATAHCLSHDGKHWICALQSGGIQVWDLKKGEVLQSVPADASESITRLAAFPHVNEILALNLRAANPVVRDLKSGKTRRGSDKNMLGTSMTISPTGEVFAFGYLTGDLVEWSAKTLEIEKKAVMGGPIMSVAYSNDGKMLAVGWLDGDDHVVSLRDAATFKQLRVCAGAIFTVHNVAFTPDNKWVVSGTGADRDRAKVCVWDVASGQLVQFFSPCADGCTGMAMSPNGKWLATTDFAGKLWITDFERLTRGIRK
jgi:WD40 repeat protein